MRNGPLLPWLMIGCVLGGGIAPAQTILGPLPLSSAYLSFADSPFNGVAFDYFHLEDWEDDLLNTPGVASSSSILSSAFGSSVIDSVDADDGAINGIGGGQANWGSGSLTYTFDALALGALPTHAGFAWTDGLGTITFEAFDALGISLGTATGTHADGNFLGGTAEDRFYGAIHAGGISRIRISNTDGVEVDHLQYGRASVPDAGSTLTLASAATAVLLAFRSRNRRR